MKVAVLLKWKA